MNTKMQPYTDKVFQAEKIIQNLESLDRNLSEGNQPMIDQLQKIADENNDETLKAHAIYFNARIKENKGNTNEAVRLYEQALPCFERQLAEEKLIDTLNRLGWCKGYLLGGVSEGLPFIKQAIALSENINYQKGFSDAYNVMGAIHCSLGNYPQALDYYILSLKIRKETGDTHKIASSFSNIAIIYAEQGNYPQALDYYLQSLKIREEAQDKHYIPYSFNNIASIYHKQGNIDLALVYLTRALRIFEDKGNKYGMALSYINLPTLYLELNEISKANEYSAKGLQIAEEINSLSLIIMARTSIAAVLIKEMNFVEASSHLQQTLKLTEETSEKPMQKIVLEKLYECFKTMNDAVKALEYYEKYVKIEKELINEETSRKIAGLQMAAEIENKENERELAKKEAEIERLKNVELKQAYENLQQAQEELIRKERMAAIGKIASDIAHEVQNPLNFVNNFSEVNSEIVKELVDEIKLNGLSDYAKELIKDLNNNSASININGKRAAGIVSQLLELTRQNRVHTNE